MKKPLFLLAAVAILFASASFTRAASDDAAQKAWLEKAKAAYPLQTCVVSGEELKAGDMGPPVDYIYKQEGKPDRLVRFCCKMCIAKFKKDPAKYLQQLDAASAQPAGK